MLETMQERVKLLKVGISGKLLEDLYIAGNNMKIVNKKGDCKMLETRQERVYLLKAGISGKRIEELYIAGNNMKIVNLKLLHIGKEFPMG